MPSLFWPYRWGWVAGAQLFVAHNDLNPCPPPKTISTIFLCCESAGITLSASQMSKRECGSHQGRALSVHTLDNHSARVNKPQPSLICFIFHKERKPRNLITKRIFWGLDLMKFQGWWRKSEVNFSFALLYLLRHHWECNLVIDLSIHCLK